jgi:DNA polymerase III alpha subunit (gram-positive type)
MSINPLIHIAFEDIDDTYCWGKYAGLEVIMMKSNGYINATKMCNHISNAIGKQKSFRSWKRDASSIELIDALSVSVQICTDALLIKPNVRIELRGTYVHPKLIPDIASWASKKFALKAADIVNQYFNDKALAEKNVIIQHHARKIDKLLRKMDQQTETIKQQTDTIKQQTAMIQKQSDDVKTLLTKNDHISHEISHVKKQNEQTNAQNNTLLDMVAEKSEHQVMVPSNEAKTHTFTLLRNNDPDYDYMYYVIRIQKRNLKTRLRMHAREHPHAVSLVSIDYQPNGINFWNVMKEQLHDYIEYVNCDFNLLKGYPEEDMIKFVTELNESRFD